MSPQDKPANDASAAAHDEILECTENLTNLADYCEKNYKESKVEVERPEVTIDNARKAAFFSFSRGKTLKKREFTNLFNNDPLSVCLSVPVTPPRPLDRF